MKQENLILFYVVVMLVLFVVGAIGLGYAIFKYKDLTKQPLTYVIEEYKLNSCMCGMPNGDTFYFDAQRNWINPTPKK